MPHLSISRSASSKMQPAYLDSEILVVPGLGVEILHAKRSEVIKLPVNFELVLQIRTRLLVFKPLFIQSWLDFLFEMSQRFSYRCF